ncbi:MAG: radical SAM/SPASM domain-containing protein [Candidatus Nanoarchaeia archaeon]|nr:radical SAM/SPASM domain-containing protein [Candidatus Nanoarchaeia archaeon]
MFKITERIDKVTNVGSDRLKEVLPAPKSVKIELTSRCNYRCAFCSHQTKKSTSDMDLNLFKRITKEMQEAGVTEIGLFYLGESFTNPTLLVNAIKYLKQDLNFPYTFLTSNASLANPEQVEACMAAGLDSLKWSCNTANPEQFKKVVQVSEKMFHKSLNNIKSAYEIRKAKGYKTGLFASSIRYDDEQHETMMQMLNEKVIPYVDEHYWLPLYTMGSLSTVRREADLGYRPTAGNQGRQDALVNPLPCWTVFTASHVIANGKVSACCFDANENWIMGDLTKQSFMDVWNSEEYQKLRKAHIAKNIKGTVCENCVAYK